MEKISSKKELYFVGYVISKFRDFSRFFIQFVGTFSNFEHIYNNIPLIFEVEIYKNTPIF